MASEIKISIKGLYKIFGESPLKMMDLLHNGIGKQELLEQHNHVLGLQDINIDIEVGKITVIMGLSGSGKSTLIRHINRLIDPTVGAVVVDGEDIMQFNLQRLRELRLNKMSMVFQKFALLPHKIVLDNAAIGPLVRGDGKEIAEEIANKWLERVGLNGFANHYPHQLSGGMQQRVGLARALSSNSETMLMDEAFSALDPLIRTNMQDLLLGLQADLHKTTIFITHDLDEALKLADNLVILKDGHIVQQGEPQHILLHPNDPYIEDFVSDINRARVLRVRSVMKELTSDNIKYSGHINHDDTLEAVISLSGGDTSHEYLVKKDSQDVGVLDMKDLIKALVPRIQNNKSVA